MMKLYRKRLIPEEIIELKHDKIIYEDEDKIITQWQVIHPRKDFTHGCSCYFMKEGFKVSKFLREDGSLKCWYCDIIRQERTGDGIVFVDLLADVIIDEAGSLKVVDLDELAEAFEKKLITKEEMAMALRQLDGLLHKIYNGEFEQYKKLLEG